MSKIKNMNSVFNLQKQPLLNDKIVHLKCIDFHRKILKGSENVKNLLVIHGTILHDSFGLCLSHERNLHKQFIVKLLYL